MSDTTPDKAKPALGNGEGGAATAPGPATTHLLPPEHWTHLGRVTLTSIFPKVAVKISPNVQRL